MTANRTFLPELNCRHCDYVGDNYKVEEQNGHHKASCPNCGQYIKFISKEDKYGTTEQQKEIWEKTKGRCCYCGIALNPFERNGYTYEHVTPQIKGGEHHTENLMPCCKSCNSSKGGKTLKEYRDYMRKQNGAPTHVFYFEVVEYGPVRLREIIDKLF